MGLEGWQDHLRIQLLERRLMSTVVKPSKQPLHLFLMLVTVFAALSYMLAFAMDDDNRTGGLLTG